METGSGDPFVDNFCCALTYPSPTKTGTTGGTNFIEVDITQPHPSTGYTVRVFAGESDIDY